MKEIKSNALSLANQFIDMANKKDDEGFTQLKLIKLVYIAYGFGLALLNRSLLNPRFDKVEAWRYGPVIPSVYYSFNQYGSGRVTEKVKLRMDEFGNDMLDAPLEDEEARQICKLVWGLYGKYTGAQLVDVLHKPGTPWYSSYRPGQNCEIPESLTLRYYSLLCQKMREGWKN